MVSKKNKPMRQEAGKFPRKYAPLSILQSDGESEIARKQTALLTSSEMAAMRVIRGAESKSGNWESIDVPFLIEQLREQSAAVNRNDMAQAEAMLMNQATALQSLFARLAERGMACENAPGFEANFRMALRAQSQCRATLETLAAIKNPPIVYAKQANVTTGPQQINNGTVVPTRAREIETEQTQLSGENYELLPNARASGNASRVDSTMEAVGEINRAEIGGGKNNISKTRV